MDDKSNLEKILDAKELAEVQMFLERPVMVEAIRKVMFWPIAKQGTFEPGVSIEPNRNFLFQLVASQMGQGGVINDEMLGQEVRAKWKAVEWIQGAFKELEALKKVLEVEKVKENKAR